MTENVFTATYGNFSLSVASCHSGLLNITESGIELVNLRIDLITAEYTTPLGVNYYTTLGSAVTYCGFDFEKGIGFDIKAVAKFTDVEKTTI
ncbi:MAG TPA: hypothetical protein VIK94_00540 [Bacilli bacterium]